MTSRAITMVFSAYLVVLGAILILVPNFLLQLFGLPQTEEVWVRVVGMLVGILAWYYYAAAKSGNVDFLRATIPGRTAVLVFLTLFVLAGLTKPIIILFGVVDVGFALLTWKALRTEAGSSPTAELQS